MPNMEHVGDITELHGGKLPPVDIISFGSPCQGLSAAGKRLGLADPRSGLFSEAIRIINEMREATDGRYPRFALWENVPGAMHSNGGLDFKAVLEAFAEAEVPVPRSAKWANSGMVRSGRAHIAWCVYNAQYFGTAQRRRRIFLVADFTGESSGEILFIPKSLRGYFEAGGTPWQGAPTNAFGCVDSEALCLNDQGGDSINVEKGGQSPTLRSETHGNLPVVAKSVDCLTPWDTQQSRIYADNGSSPTLAGASVVSPLAKPVHEFAVESLGELINAPPDFFPVHDGGGGRNPAGLVCTAGFNAGAGAKALGIGFARECSPTMKSGGGAPSVVCATEQLGVVGVHQSPEGDIRTSPTAYTLTTNSGATSRNAPLVAHPQICGTLCASGSGLNRPGGMGSETDLCIVIPIQDKATRCSGGGETRNNDGCGNGLGVGKDGDPAPTLTSGDRHSVAAYCLQGSMVGRQDRNGPNGSGVNDNLSFTLNTIDRHAVVTSEHAKSVAFSLDSAESNSMKSANPNSGCRITETARTIDTTVPCPSKNQGGIAIVQQSDTQAFIRERSDKFSKGDIASTQTARQHKDSTDLICTASLFSPTAKMALENTVEASALSEQSHRYLPASVDCRNLSETEELSGTLQAKGSPGYSLNCQNPIRMGYIVRRLTPTECERLQGYPDGWTEFDVDGKPISDTRRYQMLGNSVAVPCVAYIMQGIAQVFAA